MGHYDTCRPENCGACGQALGVVWGCGRERCSTYHKFLRQKGRTAELNQILGKIKVENEAAEEARVTKRQIERRTKELAAKAKQEALS